MKNKKIAFWIIAFSLVVIAYYGLNANPGDKGAPKTTSISQENNTQPESKTQTDSDNQSADSNAPEPTVSNPQVNEKDTLTDNDTAIKITKSQITSTASFLPYTLDGVNMEIIAVKASDGTIRTALNTCQVCYDSGRGYYVQEGAYLVCQNCGNRFHIDQVENIKGGCNPVPIAEEDKKDLGDTILYPRISSPVRSNTSPPGRDKPPPGEQRPGIHPQAANASRKSV